MESEAVVVWVACAIFAGPIHWDFNPLSFKASAK
jgi:hypothetical protein